MANDVKDGRRLAGLEIQPLTPDEWREAILSTVEEDDV